MHKIFYIKKETLCALLLPTLHNPPVLFSAWREFSTLDRSLASGLLGRASSEGDVQSAEMWTTHQVFLTGTSKALRTSQIKQNRCTFASLSAHTRARASTHTHCEEHREEGGSERQWRRDAGAPSSLALSERSREMRLHWARRRTGCFSPLFSSLLIISPSTFASHRSRQSTRLLDLFMLLYI